MDDLLTIKETAALMRLRPWSIYGSVKAGKIPAVRLPNGQLRVPRGELERLLDATRIVPQRLP